MRVAARNLEGRTILAEIIGCTGRPALLLKGVDLAERVYANLGQRAMGDIDFLVQAGDVPAYHENLSSAGFRASPLPSAELISASWEHHSVDLPPEGKRSLPLELHWRLSQGPYVAGIDMPALWGRALPHPTFAPGARVMAADDLFLYLCLHLKHHTFEVPLTSFWDLAELLNSPSLLLDWPTIWRRAEAWELTRSIPIALYLVTHVLGVPTRHLSDWAPDAPLAAQLPDPLALIGRYPEMSEFTAARLGMLLSANASWRQRSVALIQGVVPSRLEVRSRYGVHKRGLARDIALYIKRFCLIWHDKWRFILAYFNKESDARERTDRVVKLRTYLEASPDAGED